MARLCSSSNDVGFFLAKIGRRCRYRTLGTRGTSRFRIVPGSAPTPVASLEEVSELSDE